MDQLSSRTPIKDDGGYEPLQTEAQSTTTCALKRQQKQQQLAVHLKIEKKVKNKSVNEEREPSFELSIQRLLL
jgi:hypothetical protein